MIEYMVSIYSGNGAMSMYQVKHINVVLGEKMTYHPVKTTSSTHEDIKR